MTAKVHIEQAAATSGWDYKGLDENGTDDRMFMANHARLGGAYQHAPGRVQVVPASDLLCQHSAVRPR